MHIPPINRLDPQQKEFLKVLEKYLRGETRQFGNQWICGFAGSGKSVLLAYFQYISSLKGTKNCCIESRKDVGNCKGHL